MINHDIVVIGASAGGLEALTALVHTLPDRLHAAIFIVIHFPTNSTSNLPSILTRKTLLPTVHPENGETIQEGKIYIAPPDHHLILKDGKIILDHGPRQNGFRPSIDPLFRSAARQYRERTIGILLSGLLDDGVFGMQEIKQRGGITIAQDPEEALFNALPLAAIDYGVVDYILPVHKISEIISRDGRSSDELPGETQMTDSSNHEEKSIQADIDQFEEEGKPIDPTTTVMTCPECGGVLWEVNDDKITRYSCHVGHTYSTDTMLEEQSRAIEGALWTAIRAIKERVFLLRRLATISKSNGAAKLEKRYTEHANELEGSADLLRRSLLDGNLKTVTGEDLKNQEPK